MQSFEQLLDRGLAVMCVEVRSAKPDQFAYVSKKSGQKVNVVLVRLALEVQTGDSIEQVQGTVPDTQTIPSWAVKGANVYIGCSELKREQGRLSVRVVDAVPVKSIKDQ